MKKRLLSSLLALSMILSLLPGTAWAAQAEESAAEIGAEYTPADEAEDTVNPDGEDPEDMIVPDGGIQEAPEESGGFPEDPVQTPDSGEQEDGTLLEDDQTGGGEGTPTTPQMENWSFTIEAGDDVFHYEYITGTMTVNGTEVPGGDYGEWPVDGGVTVRVSGVGDEYPDVVLANANLSKLRVHLQNMPRFAVRLYGDNTVYYTAGANSENPDIAARDPAVLLTTDRNAEIAFLCDSETVPGTLTINSAGQAIRLDSDDGALALRGGVTVNVNYIGTTPALPDYANGDIWSMDFNAVTQFGGARIFGSLKIESGASMDVSAYYLPLDVYGVVEVADGGTSLTVSPLAGQPNREAINTYGLWCHDGARITAMPQKGASEFAQISVRGPSLIRHDAVVEAQSFCVQASVERDEFGNMTSIIPSGLDVMDGGQLIVHPTALRAEFIEGSSCVIDAPGLTINDGSRVNVENGGSIRVENWIDQTGGAYDSGCVHGVMVVNYENTTETSELRIGPGGWVDVPVELPRGQGVWIENNSQVLLEGGNLDIRLAAPTGEGMRLRGDDSFTTRPALRVTGGWVNIRDEYTYNTPADIWADTALVEGCGLGVDNGTVTLNANWDPEDPNLPVYKAGYLGGVSIDVAAIQALGFYNGGTLELNAGEMSVNGRCEYVYIPGAAEFSDGGRLEMTGGVLDIHGVRRGLVVENGGTANISGGEVVAGVDDAGDSAVQWGPEAGALTLTGGVAAYDGGWNEARPAGGEPDPENPGAPVWFYLSYVRLVNRETTASSRPRMEGWYFTIEAGDDVFDCDYREGTMTVNGKTSYLSSAGEWTGNASGVTVRVSGVGDEFPDVVLTNAELSKLHIHLQNMPRFAVHLEGTSAVNYTPAAAESGNIADRDPAVFFTTDRGADIAILPRGTNENPLPGKLNINSTGQAIRLDSNGGVLRLDSGVTVNVNYSGTTPKLSDYTNGSIWDMDYNATTQFGGVRINGDLQIYNAANLNINAFYLPLDVQGTLDVRHLDAILTASAMPGQPCRETINASYLHCVDGARIDVPVREGQQAPGQIVVYGPDGNSLIADGAVVDAQQFVVSAIIDDDGVHPSRLDVVDGGQLIIHPTALEVENTLDKNGQPISGRKCVMGASGMTICDGSWVNVENGGSIRAEGWKDSTGGTAWQDGCIRAIEIISGQYWSRPEGDPDRKLLKAENPATLRLSPGGWVDVPVELPMGQGVWIENNSQLLLDGGSLNVRLKDQTSEGIRLRGNDGFDLPELRVTGNWVSIWDEYTYNTPADIWADPVPASGCGLVVDNGTVTLDAWWDPEDPNRPEDPSIYPGGISIDVASIEALGVYNGGTLELRSGEVNVNGRCEYVYVPGAAEFSNGGHLNMTGGLLRAHGVRRGLVVENDGTAMISGGEIIASTEGNFDAVSWSDGALNLTGNVAAYDGERNEVQPEGRAPDPENPGAPVWSYPLSYVRITDHPDFSADDNGLTPDNEWLKISIFDEYGGEWVWEFRNGHVADWKGNFVNQDEYYGAPPAGVSLNWYDAAKGREDGFVASDDHAVLTLNNAKLQQIQINAERLSGPVTIRLVGDCVLNDNVRPDAPALQLYGGADYILDGGGTLTIRTENQAVHANLYGLWGDGGALTVRGATLDAGCPDGFTPAENMLDDAYWNNRSALGGMLWTGGELTVENGGKIIISAYAAPLAGEDCTVRGDGSEIKVKMLHTSHNVPDFFAMDVCRLMVLDGAAVTVDAFSDIKQPVGGVTPVSILVSGEGSLVKGGTLTAETLHIHGGWKYDGSTGEMKECPGRLTVEAGGKVNLAPLQIRRSGENGETWWGGEPGMMLFEGSTLAVAGGTVTVTEQDPGQDTGDSYNAGINVCDPGCAIDVSGGRLEIKMAGSGYVNGIRLSAGGVLRQTGGEIVIDSTGPCVEMEGSTASLTGGKLTATAKNECAFILREGRVSEDSQSVGSELEISGSAVVTLKSENRSALLVGDGGAASMLIVRGGELNAEGVRGIFAEFNSQAWFLGGTTTAKGRFRTMLANPEKLCEQSDFDWDSGGTWVGDAICGTGDVYLGVGVFAMDGQGIAAQVEKSDNWSYFAPVYLDAEYTTDDEGYHCGTMTTILSATEGKAPYSEALEVTSGQITAGVPFTVRAIYTGVTGQVTITLPDGVTYREGSLTVNAKQVTPGVGGKSLTVSLTDGGTVRFSAIAGGAGDYEITTLADGKTGRLPFKADPLQLELPSATARTQVTVSGVASEGTMVIYSVEADGTQIVELGRANVNALGSWRTPIMLPLADENGKENQDIQIQGVLVSKSGTEIAETEIYTLCYRPNNVDIETLTITNEIHDSVPGETVTNQVVIDYVKNTRTPSYLTYWPELPYLHFEAQFTNNSAVDSAWVVATDRQGNEVRIPLMIEGGKWVEDPVAGGFYPDNQLFPEQYRVEWVPKDTAAEPSPDEPARVEPDGMLVELEQGQRYVIQSYSGEYEIVNEAGETVTDYTQPGLYTVTTTQGFKQPVYRGNKLFLLVKAGGDGGKTFYKYQDNVHIADGKATVTGTDNQKRDAGLEEIFAELVINGGIVEPGPIYNDDVAALEEEVRAAFLESDMYQAVLYAMEAGAEKAGATLYGDDDDGPKVEAEVIAEVTTDGVNPTVSLTVSISAEAEAELGGKTFYLSFNAETRTENTLSFDCYLTGGKLRSLYLANTATDTANISFNATTQEPSEDSSEDSSVVEQLKADLEKFFEEVENVEKTLERLSNGSPDSKEGPGKRLTIPTTVPGLFVYLEVTPILDFDWNGEIVSRFHTVQSNKAGFRWSEAGGMETFRSNSGPTMDVSGEIHAIVTAKAGLDLAVGLSAYTCLNAGTYGNASLVAKAEGHGRFSAGSTGGGRAEYFAGVGVEANLGVECSLTLGNYATLWSARKDLLTYRRDLWSAGSKVMPTRFSVVEGREQGYVSVSQKTTNLLDGELIDLELTYTDFTTASVFDEGYTQEKSKRFDNKYYTFELVAPTPPQVHLSGSILTVDTDNVPEDGINFKIKVTYTGSEENYTIYKVVPLRYEEGMVGIIKRVSPDGSKVAGFKITHIETNIDGKEITVDDGEVSTDESGYVEFKAVVGLTYTVTEIYCAPDYKCLDPIQTIEVLATGCNRLTFVNVKDLEDDPTIIGPNVPTPVSRDPSGYVYEGIPSNRLSGVTVTVYYSDSAGKPTANAVESMRWDAAAFDQENPLTTDPLGQYQWMVPDGWWQVKYEKNGYETVWSDWLPVPPVQTEVNVEMKRSEAAELIRVEQEGKQLMLVFDRPVSATKGKVTVTNFLGETLEGILLPVKPEKPGTADLYGSEDYYASVFYYVLKEAPAAGRDLTVASSLTTYNGKTGETSQTVAVPGTPAQHYELSCQNSGGSAVVTARVETTGTVLLVVAAYDKDGKQVAITTTSFPGSVQPQNCTLKLPGDAFTVRAFALDKESHAPLGRSGEWKITELSAKFAYRSVKG